MKTFRSLIIAIMILVLGSTSTFAVETGDTSYSPWAKESIEKAIGYELVPKNLIGEYQKDITRQEFATLIVNIIEKITDDAVEYSDNVFTDVDNVDISKAYYYGVVNGIGNNKFAPNNKITREEIAVMLIRMLENMEEKEKETFLNRSKEEVYFQDEAAMSEWSKDSIRKAYVNKIMDGIGNNMIDPLGNATREQSIALVVRIYERFSLSIAEATLKDGIRFFDTTEEIAIESEIESFDSVESGREMVFSQMPEPLKSMNEGEVLLLGSSERNPYGTIGRIIEKGENSITLGYVDPLSIFNDVNINIHKPLNGDNIMMSDGYEKSANNSIFKKVAYNEQSLNGGGQTYVKSSNVVNEKSSEGNIEVCGVSIDGDAIVVSLDGFEIEFDNGSSIKMDGTIALSEITPNVEIYKTKSGNLEKAFVEVVGNYKGQYEVVYKIIDPDAGIDDETSNGFEVKLNETAFEINGVESDSINIVDILQSPYQFSVKDVNGKEKNVGIGFVMALVLDVDGSISLEVKTAFNHEYDIEVGKGIARNGVAVALPYYKEIDDDEPATNVIEKINRFSKKLLSFLKHPIKESIDKIIEKNFVRYNKLEITPISNTISFSVDGKLEGVLKGGVDTYLIICDVVPILLETHFGAKTKLDIGGKVDCLFTPFKGDIPETGSEKLSRVGMRAYAEIREASFMLGNYNKLMFRLEFEGPKDKSLELEFEAENNNYFQDKSFNFKNVTFTDKKMNEFIGLTNEELTAKLSKYRRNDYWNNELFLAHINDYKDESKMSLKEFRKAIFTDDSLLKDIFNDDVMTYVESIASYENYPFVFVMKDGIVDKVTVSPMNTYFEIEGLVGDKIKGDINFFDVVGDSEKTIKVYIGGKVYYRQTYKMAIDNSNDHYMIESLSKERDGELLIVSMSKEKGEISNIVYGTYIEKGMSRDEVIRIIGEPLSITVNEATDEAKSIYEYYYDGLEIEIRYGEVLSFKRTNDNYDGVFQKPKMALKDVDITTLRTYEQVVEAFGAAQSTHSVWNIHYFYIGDNDYMTIRYNSNDHYAKDTKYNMTDKINEYFHRVSWISVLYKTFIDDLKQPSNPKGSIGYGMEQSEMMDVLGQPNKVTFTNDSVTNLLYDDLSLYTAISEPRFASKEWKVYKWKQRETSGYDQFTKGNTGLLEFDENTELTVDQVIDLIGNPRTMSNRSMSYDEFILYFDGYYKIKKKSDLTNGDNTIMME